MGVSPQTLRVWEQNGLLTPTRTSGGQRIYADSDLQRARQIAQMKNRHGLRYTALGELPSRTETAVGSRIGEVRRARDLTQTQFAALVGLSRSHLAAIERGDAPLTFAVLSKAADALGIPARELGPRAASPELIVRSGRGSKTDLAGVVWEELSSHGHDLEPALLVVPSNTGSGSAPTVRPGSTFLYVLSGALHFEFAGRPDERLDAGDAITLPPELAWTWWNRGDSPARVLYVESTKRKPRN